MCKYIHNSFNRIRLINSIWWLNLVPAKAHVTVVVKDLLVWIGYFLDIFY